MKKILALGLSACMMASITACSTGTGASATTAGTSAETTADTAAASESAETTDRESGAGKVLEIPPQGIRSRRSLFWFISMTLMR